MRPVRSTGPWEMNRFCVEDVARTMPGAAVLTGIPICLEAISQ
jgi:hypothetical protein